MKLADDIIYIGVEDKKIDLFEGQYTVPNGMTYNSYVILDEKIAVLDTVDAHFTDEWLSKLKTALNGKTPDYLIVQHMEPDHSANIKNFLEAYPQAAVIANAKTFAMIKSYFKIDLGDRAISVTNAGTLSLGKHLLNFIFAPMVHWPEVMVTYDSTDKILFSADAFGRFGDADEKSPWDDEARRYYIGIVGKYGVQVQSLLKKAGDLDINAIYPLHGPILTENLGHYIKLYDLWSSYTPEADGTVIAYTSVYGHTKAAAELLYNKLSSKNKTVEIYDLAREDMAKVVAQSFKYSKTVLATTTYNNDVFPFMRQFIDHLTERNFQNRTVGIIENGSWAPTAAKVIKEMLSGCKNLNITENTVSISAAVDDKNIEEIDRLADELCR